MTQRYTTKQDAIEHEIIPTLGDFGDDYDLDAIFEACFEYQIDVDDRGRELADTAGYAQVVDEEAFWAAVEKADISGAR